MSRIERTGLIAVLCACMYNNNNDIEFRARFTARYVCEGKGGPNGSSHLEPTP